MDTILEQIQQTSLAEWLGTATGPIAVYLSIKQKVLAWPLYILCYGLYAYLSFTAGLYATMGLNTCFILISIYGWWEWTRPRSDDEAGDAKAQFAISRIGKAALVWTAGIAVVGTAAVGVLLSRYTDGSAPYLDAFATTLSFVAQWMLGKKHIENWLTWIVADSAFVVLWGSQGYWVATTMFVLFTGLAVKGYFSWRKEIRSRAD